MENFTITGNTIRFSSNSITGNRHAGFDVSTDLSDANYPNGQLHNVVISGNAVRNHKIGVWFNNALSRNVVIDGNTFYAKPFTESGFNASTTLNTYATVMVDSSDTSALDEVTFTDNRINGSEYLFATDDGLGTGVNLPRAITGNHLQYIKNFKTSDMDLPNVPNAFRNNTGDFFLDRTGWVSGTALNNNLGDGSTFDSYRKYSFSYNGTNVIFYTDDSGTSITL